jgi:glycerophosphoryl diester phosphodiesterase
LFIVIGALLFTPFLGCSRCKVNRISRPPDDFQSPNHTEYSIQEWRDLKKKRGQLDPIFKNDNLYRPLLFAHRGGVLEAPESTKRAFRYALDEAGADVLELDVQLTKDGRFVVWHGPDLCNVYIEGENPIPQLRPKDRQNIEDFTWEELNGNAWVADPWECCLTNVLQYKDRDDRRLMLLSEFLNSFPNAPLNIEMKESFDEKSGKRKGLKENVDAFLDILEKGRGSRTVVVASASHSILKEFHKQCREKGLDYPTALSGLEIFKFLILNVVSVRQDLHDRAMECYPEVGTKGTIHGMRKNGGATYVFLSGLGPLSKSLDKEDLTHKQIQQKIIDLLNQGADGIMTDKPKEVRKIMHQWLETKP